MDAPPSDAPRLPHPRGRRALQLAAAALALGAGWLLDELVPDDLWRLALGAAAAGVLFAAPASPRRPRRATAIVLLALVSLGATAGRDLERFATKDHVRVWNVFHYDLGAKYFAELGYRDLYAAALTADRLGAGRWASVEIVRDLETYEPVPRQVVESRFDPGRFTPRRWQEFTADVAALQRYGSEKTWRGIFRDRGYNPSPAWTALGKTLAALLPTTSPGALRLRCSLDLLLLAATFALLWRALGAEAAGIALLCFCLTPVNAGRLVGNFLQYDWFCAVALAVAALARGRERLAGAALAYATLTRVFPLLLVASATLPALAHWVGSGVLAPRWRRFVVAFTVAVGVGLGLTAAAGLGPGAWGQFFDNLRLHRQHHTFGEQRVGLEHLFTHDLGSLDVDEGRGEREAARREQHPAFVAAKLVLLLAWIAACLRRNLRDGVLLGLVPFFALAVSSRYYWALLALVPLLSQPGPWGRRRRLRLGGGQCALFAAVALVAHTVGERYATYLSLNLGLTFYLLAVLAHVAWRDATVLLRRRAAQPVETS